MSSRSAKERIQDILSAIDSIQSRTAGISFDQFSQNETIVKAVLYDLIIIGEAAINIPADIQASAPEIPWRLMGDMRNIMAHEYFQISLRITWSTIQNNLPILIDPLQQLQANL
ncbi:hypothetical protein AMR42_08970 [Limnothrix sp. PR1529]|uniref:HepT-like ribonuclease domain-containing protein n=1 Tax=unclassified Limnothrix TaxID=2632864 RepID=UPI00081E020D|nr:MULTISPECIES: DUF86 domain-containing protein [unclassified Limnothrix]MBD2159735.1 DUF86 domain-containing protein [Limnothrix sp. FACHB-1083]MBD2190438.1 DUF86 domain-containing protein [Limnothrix sp. FACHB-1088]OCQ93217.1 hypothetical protein BCR12_12985 [Limnothrix sp. P13C2]PIB12984.1 hypothetical protein AMR42_08970 [Limnothrix sp. PR1529]